MLTIAMGAPRAPLRRLVTLAVGLLCLAGASALAGETEVALTFTGGHDTDPRDGGRPVVLVAGALGVKPEVFRQAFSGVRPAHDGKPSPEDARRNKAALMAVLGPLGVTNDRLDEVSNYYRYQPQKGDLWKVTPAQAHAVLVDGRVKQIVVTAAGSGYSSPPTVTGPGLEQLKFEVTLKFDPDFKRNGAIASIAVVPEK